MAVTARHLRVVPPVEPAMTLVPTADLERAISNIAGLADDLEAGLEAIASRIWAGSRSAALNELGRLDIRVQRLRDDYAALAPSTSATAI